MRLVLLLAFALAITAAFSPGLSGDFLFDDYPVIVSNPALHAEQVSIGSLTTAATAFNAGGTGRQLASISFALNHALHESNPLGYKAANVVLHILNAVLVWWLCLLLFRWVATPEQQAQLAATACALTWALHPLQVSTVLYVVQRMEILSLSFVLVALVLYVLGRSRQCNDQPGWWLIGISAPIAAMGILSKESAALFPAYVLALEWALFRLKSPVRRDRLILCSLATATIAAGLAAIVLWLIPTYLETGSAYAGRDFNSSDRLLTQGRVLALYLGQIVAPLPESMPFYYDQLEPSRGWLKPVSTIFSWALLTALVIAAVATRRRAPLFSFGLALFFSGHLITSNIVPLELAFEHRNYFALLGIVFCFATLISRIAPKDGPAIKYFAISSVIIGLAVLTAIRSAVWGDPFVLATDLAEKNSMSARAANDLAAIYAGMSDDNPNSPFYAFAISEFRRSSQLPRATALSDLGLIITTAHAGQAAPDSSWNSLNAKLEHRPIDIATVSAMVRMAVRSQELAAIDDHQLSAAYATMARQINYRMDPAHLAVLADHAISLAAAPDLAKELYLAAVDASTDRPEFVVDLMLGLVASGHDSLANSVLFHAGELGILSATQ